MQQLNSQKSIVAVVSHHSLDPFQVVCESSTHWVVYEQQECISHRSGICEIQGESAGRFDVW